MKIKNGFTLAEVLITLGIIGVVTTITIPSLMTNHRKSVVESRLQKFNSMMMQALTESEKDNGIYEDWPIANNDTSESKPFEFFNKYLKPYLKTTSVSKISETNTKVYLADGSSIEILRGDCYEFKYDINGDTKPNVDGKDKFTFLICKSGANPLLCVNSKSPWCSYGATNDRTEAFKQCKKYGNCSRLLELEEWKIPKDYPYSI